MSENYEQLKKNNVKATNQVAENVFLENEDGAGIRVLIMGNSITLHGILPEIGWHHNFGMAASSKENDFVHKLYAKIREKQPDAALCICQVADWETAYKNGESVYSQYEAGRKFDADIIIARFLDNCPKDDLDGEIFKKEIKKFIEYLNPSKKAKIIATTGFWKHPADSAMTEFAEENGIPLVYLGDLGEDDNMKAIGKFEHGGVANHPGDLGMEHIANRIYDKLKDLI